MEMKNQTPIEEIFSGSHSSPDYLTKRALDFCGAYDIRTAEQLASVCQSSLIQMVPRSGVHMGPRTIKYILGKMRRGGFPISQRKFKRKSAFQIIGKENIKNYLLAAMTDVPAPKYAISSDARRALWRSLDGHLFESIPSATSTKERSLYKDREFRDYSEYEIRMFSFSAFDSPHVAPLFDELVKEGRAAAKPQERKRDVLGYYVPERVKNETRKSNNSA